MRLIFLLLLAGCAANNEPLRVVETQGDVSQDIAALKASVESSIHAQTQATADLRAEVQAVKVQVSTQKTISYGYDVWAVRLAVVLGFVWWTYRAYLAFRNRRRKVFRK